MVDFIVGLEDWAVKEAVDKVIAGYITNGTISAADQPAFEKVGIDVANIIIQMMAQKVGVPGA